ncbi:uncharacterized protein LOC133781994 [Humulus lupulus]|uniref:uncharacterized protein LOC133781994 n=1 Tax=Humulus lupulus TaxID=3486 RepID=UPI002B400A98|nr:uncharacterized protein LOC133781994 [Humulus lupulus]
MKCFNFTASRDWLYRQSFAAAGMRSVTTDLGDGTVMHCWAPKQPRKNNNDPNSKVARPAVVLLHGFGANAMWQYGDHLRHLTARFDVYVPDLLFFGGSYTEASERSEAFQARCVRRLLEEAHGVRRMRLVGISYGGFVAYSMAAQFPEMVESVVVCCAGVCLEEADMAEGMFRVPDLEEAASILLPQTPNKLRELMRLSFVKPARVVPSCFLSDFIDVMCTEFVEEKRELIQEILKGRKLSNLPQIKQPTLIIWGDQDQIFPLELGYRLKRHLGENAELVIIKNAGHAVNLEKPKEFVKHMKSFLVNSLSSPLKD